MRSTPPRRGRCRGRGSVASVCACEQFHELCHIPGPFQFPNLRILVTGLETRSVSQARRLGHGVTYTTRPAGAHGWCAARQERYNPLKVDDEPQEALAKVRTDFSVR